MVIQNIYSKIFSKIGSIQDEESIFYNLSTNYVDNLEMYGIQIVSKNNAINYEEAIESISSSKDLVVNILTYMYENSVKPMFFKEILSDIFGQDAKNLKKWY